MAHPMLIVTAVEAEAEAVRAGIEAGRARIEAGRAGIEAGRARIEAGRARIEAGRAGIPGWPGDSPGSFVVEAVGVGPAAAAAGTARLLATGRYRAVLSAGIAGGFAGRAPVGATVLGVRSIAADLGAESPSGFLPIDELGFGRSVIESDVALLEVLAAALPGAIAGDVLTLATVTGTAATAERLAARFPRAVAEAMEGFGVATAAAGLPSSGATTTDGRPSSGATTTDGRPSGGATAAAGLPFAELRAISNPVGPRDRAAWRLKEAFAALSTASAALWTTCG